MANRSLHPLLHYLRRLSGGRAGDSALDDAQLLHRFANQRDESAFTTIVQRYGAMVWSLCVRRLGETPEAEDAFQATFLVLVRKAVSLHGSQPLGPWLYGIAYRTALKLRGRRARQAAREVPLTEPIAEERPEQVWSDLRPILDEEIQRLPTKYRLPVLLCYLQGLSCEEAARHLGCAKGTVFSRLSRAREMLRPRLLRRGLDVSAGALAVALAENVALRAMPPVLLRETLIRTGLLLAAGTASQTLSAPLAALVEGVLRSMFLSKVKFALIIVLAIGVVGSGAGFVAHRTDAEQPATKQNPKPAAPSGGAIRTKVKADESKPYVPPPAVTDAQQRLRDWRDKLAQTVDFRGIDDARATLADALDALTKRYNLTFVINERAFRVEDQRSPNVTVWPIRKVKIAEVVFIPEMRASLGTIIRAILSRVPMPDENVEVVYLVRKDHIEITTSRFLRMELGFKNERPLLPLIRDSFQETALAQILPRLAESSGYNVMADPHAGEKLQTKITIQLNNVPIDTALRLLANMADLNVVRIDNVFYVTTEVNAAGLRQEQEQLNAAEPASDKAAK